MTTVNLTAVRYMLFPGSGIRLLQSGVFTNPVAELLRRRASLWSQSSEKLRVLE
jgi:hypothetical protein